MRDVRRGVHREPLLALWVVGLRLPFGPPLCSLWIQETTERVEVVWTVVFFHTKKTTNVNHLEVVCMEHAFGSCLYGHLDVCI